MRQFPGVLLSFAFGVATLMAAACASTPTATTSVTAPIAGEVAAKPYPEGINCVWQPMLRSGYYTVIDDQHLVIEGAGKKFYLLTLSTRCFDLDTTMTLGVSARGNQLCGPGDSLLVRGNRCSIRYLEPVASTAEAKAIVAARQAAEQAARESKAGSGN